MAPGSANPRSRNLTPKRGRQRAAQATKAKAEGLYADVLPLVRELREDGLLLAEIAEEIDGCGYLLRSGKPWNAVQGVPRARSA